MSNPTEVVLSPENTTALDRLKKILHGWYVESGGKPTVRVEIYTWDDDRDGPRVSEISYIDDTPDVGLMAGVSFMQSDLPHGIAACALTERAAIALRDDEDTDETLGSLRFALEDGS